MSTIRAIYHDGHLRLLDPVDLAEGEEVHFEIVPPPASETQRLSLRERFPDLFMTFDYEDEMPELSDEDIFRLLDEVPPLSPTISEIIIEERHQ